MIKRKVSDMEKWYKQHAEDDDIVISTRIRLARNLKSLPFKEKISRAQQTELNQRVKDALKRANPGDNKWSFFYLHELSDLEQLSLVERHLVSHTFIENPENKLLALSEDHAASIMVNEEDHLRLQALHSGLSLSEAYTACDRLDDLLDESLDYAFDGYLGYLTVCPTNLGTGMRASVMLHLPALERSQIIPQLIKTVSRLGLTIRGTYGEGTSVVGSTYQISNQVTLGLSEATAIGNLKGVVRQIIESERAARKEIVENNIDVVDEICRSYGVLKYAKLLSGNEFYEHISNVRLGASEGILEGVSVGTLNELLNRVGTATLCAASGQRLNPKERDYSRAKIVREALA